MRTPITGPSKALLDEFGEVQRQVDAFAPTAAKHKRLRDEIESYYADKDPEQEFTVSGLRYEVQIGPRAKQRTFTARGMALLYRLLGKPKFLEWCKFGLTDLDRLVPGHTGIVVEERTGSRKIKAVAKYSGAAGLKAA